VIDYPNSDATRDAVLEWVARFLEEGDFRDLAGVWAKRKRCREDAALRGAARAEMRREFAAHLWAMIGRDDLSSIAVLRRMAALPAAGNHVTELCHAWPLAWKGWLDIECIISTADNCVPPQTRYRIVLTDSGRAALEGAAP
jgi:hypothetical protein